MQNNPYHQSHVNIQGIKVHYELYEKDPSKPTMVLIHGFLSSTFSYRRLIPLLRDEFRLIAIDLPPFGKTEKSRNFVHSYKNMAGLVIELLEQLQVKNAILVGHSMGGQISLYAAKERPDMFTKTVLLCSSSYMKRLQPHLIFGSYVPYFYLCIKHWLTKQGVWKNLCNVVYDRSLIDQEMMDGYLQPFMDDTIFMALARMIRDREGDLSEAELKKIEVPSLLIWGEEDKIVPLEVGRRLSKDLPDARFHALKNTGHLVPEEKPLHVTEKIFEFCHA
ncbi:alpha/beta hydrolase [Metabacillus sp. GX 13764]|uniref:alpha/beta fold hydrolase n=1 Tax=Metabacillus kandeliae TaxID=2900151 RepID=UPI001E49FB45|nr:alpha/beta hydrolase [Metabacillus kandeliae]MCD7035750.1 alpha/beta hydrolase [Metabacillus kandeliae]